MKVRLASVFRVPIIRYAAARLRLAYLMRRRGLRTLDRHGSNAHTVTHNLRSLVGFNTRNERLLFGALVIEDVAAARVLVIGCRSEEELLMFRGYGFDNVSAIDLLSYSPWVDLADMHDMPYPDASFDLIYCAYTLSYSDDPKRAAREMLRVVADGGTIALAVEYMPHALRAQMQDTLLGYRIGGQVALDSTAAIRALFEPNVGKVFVDYDAEKKRHHSPEGLVKHPSPLICVFQVRKTQAR
jgi:SAM-dependent methyltransferase